MSEIVNVPFYGQNLVAVEKNGRIYVAMKPIVEAIGLEWNKQLELIKRDSVLSEGMTVMGIPSSGGVQKSICIPLEYLNGWLFKVPASRYVGERRKTIELYQRECYRALYDYWHRGGAVNPRLDEAQASALVGRIAEAGDGRFSDEISILLKQICERLDASTKALDRAAGRIVYLEEAQMKKETVLIAAYGTLRSGECNERFCRNAVSRRNATISGTLYDTGWGFPAFVPKGKTNVSVELIEIPIRDWADVDRLEGYPRLYDRILTDFCLPDGSTVQAWIYTMNHLPERAEVIPSGDWKVR